MRLRLQTKCAAGACAMLMAVMTLILPSCPVLAGSTSTRPSASRATQVEATATPYHQPALPDSLTCDTFYRPSAERYFDPFDWPGHLAHRQTFTDEYKHYLYADSPWRAAGFGGQGCYGYGGCGGFGYSLGWGFGFSTSLQDAGGINTAGLPY